MIQIMPDPVPLHTDEDGVVRVRGSRVPLDSIVLEFKSGATPEQIAQDYPTVSLADTYAVVTYYLRHTEEVDGYLASREQDAMKMQQQLQQRDDLKGIRERLLARLQHRGQSDASSSRG